MSVFLFIAQSVVNCLELMFYLWYLFVIIWSLFVSVVAQQHSAHGERVFGGKVFSWIIYTLPRVSDWSHWPHSQNVQGVILLTLPSLHPVPPTRLLNWHHRCQPRSHLKLLVQADDASKFIGGISRWNAWLLKDINISCLRCSLHGATNKCGKCQSFSLFCHHYLGILFWEVLAITGVTRPYWTVCRLGNLYSCHLHI
jgi:hypothetical protein